MPVAAALSGGAFHAVFQENLAEMGHESLGLGEVYELTLTRARSMKQRRADSEYGGDAPNGVRVMHEGIGGQIELGIPP
jgi:hypothetical protein